MVRLTDRPAMTIAVDLGRKATKQTKIKSFYFNFTFALIIIEYQGFLGKRRFIVDSL